MSVWCSREQALSARRLHGAERRGRRPRTVCVCKVQTPQRSPCEMTLFACRARSCLARQTTATSDIASPVLGMRVALKGWQARMPEPARNLSARNDARRLQLVDRRRSRLRGVVRQRAGADAGRADLARVGQRAGRDQAAANGRACDGRGREQSHLVVGSALVYVARSADPAPRLGAAAT